MVDECATQSTNHLRTARNVCGNALGGLYIYNMCHEYVSDDICHNDGSPLEHLPPLWHISKSQDGVPQQRYFMLFKSCHDIRWVRVTLLVTASE